MAKKGKLPGHGLDVWHYGYDAGRAGLISLVGKYRNAHLKQCYRNGYNEGQRFRQMAKASEQP